MFNKEKFLKEGNELLEIAKVFVEKSKAFAQEYDPYEEEIDELCEIDGEIALFMSEFEELDQDAEW